MFVRHFLRADEAMATVYPCVKRPSFERHSRPRDRFFEQIFAGSFLELSSLRYQDSTCG